MHKIIINTLILMVSITGITYAQKKDSIKTAVFTIDLSPPRVGTVKGVLPRNKLQFNSSELADFQLINGNPFKYKYVINTNMISFFTEGYNPVDSAFSSYKNQQLALKVNGKKLIPDSINNDKHYKQLDSTKRQKQLDSTKLKQKIISDTAKIKTLSKQQGGRQNIRKQQKKNRLEITALDSAINLNKYKMASIIKEIHSINESHTKNIANSYDWLNDNLNSGIANDPYYADVKKTLKIDTDPDAYDEQKLLKTLMKNALIINEKVSRLDDSVKDYMAELSAEDYMDVVQFKIKRESFMKGYNKILNDISNTLDAVAQSINAKDNNGYKDIRAEIDDYIKSIHNSLHNLYAVHLENYILPIDVNGKNIDLLKVTVERHESKSSALIDKYEYQLWVKGGFKMDISGGAFITSLVNNKYITVDTTVNGKVQKYINKSNIGNYQIGFGSMLNVSYRTGAGWVRPALNIGALFSNENKFQFLTGFGLMLGKEQRLILHYGLSMGNVTVLESPYVVSTNRVPNYDMGNNTQVPTAEKFEFGHYWGITYNFGSAKAKTPGAKEY